MSANDPPRQLSAFLHERIGGLDELEALLLVRTDASRRWTAAIIAASLERSESWAGPALEALCDAQLLEASGTNADRCFAYAPATPVLASLVTTVATLYTEQRAELLRMMSDNAFERIRAAAARTFSGAFEGTHDRTEPEHPSRRASARRRQGLRAERDGGFAHEVGPQLLRGRPPSGRTGAGDG